MEKDNSMLAIISSVFSDKDPFNIFLKKIDLIDDSQFMKKNLEEPLLYLKPRVKDKCVSARC